MQQLSLFQSSALLEVPRLGYWREGWDSKTANVSRAIFTMDDEIVAHIMLDRKPHDRFTASRRVKYEEINTFEKVQCMWENFFLQRDLSFSHNKRFSRMPGPGNNEYDELEYSLEIGYENQYFGCWISQEKIQIEIASPNAGSAIDQLQGNQIDALWRSRQKTNRSFAFPLKKTQLHNLQNIAFAEIQMHAQ